MQTENTSCPKVLVIGRVAWTKNESTLSGIFHGYPADKLAYVCIETREPDFSSCKHHFQISEIAMLHHFVNRRIQTGCSISSQQSEINHKNERLEQSMLSHVRSHRSILYRYLREFLWLWGGWKSKELTCFIDGFHPEVVFCVGDPMPLMNKLSRYIINIANVPSALFMMDDIYTYTNRRSFLYRLYRWLLRRQVIPLISCCKTHFAISPKMKQECDDLFGTDCVLLTKGIETFSHPLQQLHSPISIIYTGNLLYGRLGSLALIASSIKKLNEKEGCNAFLHVYTQTQLDYKQRELLTIPGTCQLYPPVPYSALKSIYDSSDIVLYVESLEEKYKYIARVSFSTKLTDYLACGRCIFAVGDEEIAPIDYLGKAGIAVICTSQEQIYDRLEDILLHQEKIFNFAKKSVNFGMRNHSMRIMRDRLINELSQLVVSDKNGKDNN